MARSPSSLVCVFLSALCLSYEPTLFALDNEPCEVQILVGNLPQSTSAFGDALDMRGHTSVVGDIGGLEAEGQAHIFQRIDGTWKQQAVLSSGVVQIENTFGHAVAISGDVIAVGDPNFNGILGAVYIYRETDNAWALEGVLYAPRNAGRFGHAISVDGDALVVGAPFYSEGFTFDIGAAYIYRFDGIEWQLEKELMNPTPAAHDIFGWAVALQDGVALIGAHGSSNNGVNFAGEANVYHWQDDDWVLAQTLMSTPVEYGWFGRSVDLQNGKAIIGAPVQGTASNHGRAHIFRNDNGLWIFEATLQASNPVGNTGYFGESSGVEP